MGFKTTLHTVIGQNWEESERGWGCRPDGFTLHLTKECREAYIKAFLDRQKAYNDEHLGPGLTPNEYTRVSGDLRVLSVSDEIYQKLMAAKDDHGIWGKGKFISSTSVLNE